MNIRSLRWRSRAAALALAWACAAGTATAKADRDSQPADETATPATAPTVPPATDRMAPAEVVKPIIPSRAELPDAAFKKLDAANKGYVTREDTRGLEGFDKAFAAADPEDTGKLRFAQFKKAWAVYSGYRDKTD